MTRKQWVRLFPKDEPAILNWFYDLHMYHGSLETKDQEESDH